MIAAVLFSETFGCQILYTNFFPLQRLLYPWAGRYQLCDSTLSASLLSAEHHHSLDIQCTTFSDWSEMSNPYTLCHIIKRYTALRYADATIHCVTIRYTTIHCVTIRFTTIRKLRFVNYDEDWERLILRMRAKSCFWIRWFSAERRVSCSGVI